MCETIVPHLGGIVDVDGESARRVRRAHHTMAPTKRTAVVPQPPVHGIDVGTIDDSDSATMASTLIFQHVAILAIDRTLDQCVSPGATAVEILPVTRRGPLTVDYILPPTCGSLSSAIMSISTHAPNGTCATLTALRAWMPRSPNTWTSSSDAPSGTAWSTRHSPSTSPATRIGGVKARKLASKKKDA